MEGTVRTFHRILVATDFSSASMPAFEQAVQLSKASGAQLLIAHAFRQEGPQEIGYAPAKGYEQWRRGVRAATEEKLEPLVSQARREGLDARPLVLEGSPDEVIVEAARREGVDLIVVGTHGRRGAERFFLGSVASRVVTASECPVMTVRAPQEGPVAGKTPT
jgi:nucleotide-binding universal stress UspA family protein